MSHDYKAQQAETFASFEAFAAEAPSVATISYQFYPEDVEPNWDGIEKALQARGFRTRRDEDDDLLDAEIGPVEHLSPAVVELPLGRGGGQHDGIPRGTAGGGGLGQDLEVHLAIEVRGQSVEHTNVLGHHEGR